MFSSTAITASLPFMSRLELLFLLQCEKTPDCGCFIFQYSSRLVSVRSVEASIGSQRQNLCLIQSKSQSDWKTDREALTSCKLGRCGMLLGLPGRR